MVDLITGWPVRGSRIRPRHQPWRCYPRKTDAKDYLKHLYRAGYLAVVQAAAPPAQGRTIYRLSKRTGGLPPQVLRTKAVYDPNTSKIEWMDMKGIES